MQQLYEMYGVCEINNTYYNDFDFCFQRLEWDGFWTAGVWSDVRELGCKDVDYKYNGVKLVL